MIAQDASDNDSEVQPTRPLLTVVSISGGKDSAAAAQIALDTYPAEQVRLVMAGIGHEHELTMRYVHEELAAALGLSVEIVTSDFSREIASKRAYVKSIWPAQGVPARSEDRALSVLHPTGVPFLDLCLCKGRFPSRKVQFCTQFLKRIPLSDDDLTSPEVLPYEDPTRPFASN